MACTTCTSSCDQCACLNQYKGKCVFYQGANLTCLDVTKGDDYDSILVKIDGIVCDLQPPSGLSVSIASCNSNIVVTENTANDFTICLSGALVTQITNNTTNISTISDCVASGVKGLISDTITITQESVDVDCGITLRLEVPTPSGIAGYDGIVYNNTTKVATSASTSTQYLKTYNRNYITNNALAVGDEIRFILTGQVVNGSFLLRDLILFEIGVGAFTLSDQTIFDSVISSSFDTPASYKLEGTLTVLDIAGKLGLLTIEVESNSQSNGTVGQLTNKLFLNVSKDVTNVDWSDLTLRAGYNHKNGNTANNYMRQFMVEVRKMIL